MANGMEKDDINRLHAKELRFFGRITASVSHEMNNVLAIVNELCGLLDDILLAAEGGQAVQCRRIQKPCGDIQKQIARGKEIVQRLNRFAHRVDDGISECDLKALLDDVIGMAQRFAKLKSVRLEAKFPEERVSLVSSSFMLQQTIFTCIDLALEASKKAQVVTVACEKQTDAAVISITFAPADETEDMQRKMAVLSSLTRRLGGKVDLTSVDDNAEAIVLSVPYSISSPVQSEES